MAFLDRCFLTMDTKYILGIPEIDAQHEEIGQLVDSFREVLTKKDQRQLVHQVLKRLHQLLVTHFTYEEAFMGMVNYDDLPRHTKNHKSVLKLFDDYFDHPPEPSDYEYFGKSLSEKVLGHVMEHDLQMTESVRQYLSKK